MDTNLREAVQSLYIRLPFLLLLMSFRVLLCVSALVASVSQSLAAPIVERDVPDVVDSTVPGLAADVTVSSALVESQSFTYGQIPPLVMVPGTGSSGCLSFGSNFIKQFTGSSFADPVWPNNPDLLLMDAQVNAEYVAYAINYISGISSNNNVSVMAWSQGNLDTQWAFKYWPSTRDIVSDFISMSPDFHGTTISYSACPEFSKLPCAPSVIQ